MLTKQVTNEFFRVFGMKSSQYSLEEIEEEISFYNLEIEQLKENSNAAILSKEVNKEIYKEINNKIKDYKKKLEKAQKIKTRIENIYCSIITKLVNAINNTTKNEINKENADTYIINLNFLLSNLENKSNITIFNEKTHLPLLKEIYTLYKENIDLNQNEKLYLDLLNIYYVGMAKKERDDIYRVEFASNLLKSQLLNRNQLTPYIDTSKN